MTVREVNACGDAAVYRIRTWENAGTARRARSQGRWAQGQCGQRELTHEGTGCNRVHDAERHGDPRPRWGHRIRLRPSGRSYDVAAGHGRGRRTGLYVLSRQQLGPEKTRAT